MINIDNHQFPDNHAPDNHGCSGESSGFCFLPVGGKQISLNKLNISSWTIVQIYHWKLGDLANLFCVLPALCGTISVYLVAPPLLEWS